MFGPYWSVAIILSKQTGIFTSLFQNKREFSQHTKAFALRPRFNSNNRARSVQLPSLNVSSSILSLQIHPKSAGVVRSPPTSKQSRPIPIQSPSTIFSQSHETDNCETNTQRPTQPSCRSFSCTLPSFSAPSWPPLKLLVMKTWLILVLRSVNLDTLETRVPS
jgi:hypothetical protein